MIPIPGHTPGSTAFLWDGGRHRFLCTGDSVWLDQAIIRRVAAGGDR